MKSKLVSKFPNLTKLRANNRNGIRSGRKHRNNIPSPENQKKISPKKPDLPKHRLSDLESADEFVFKKCSADKISETESDTENKEADQKKTILAKSFQDGQIKNIDKLTFLSQILIKKTKKLLESILNGSKLIDKTMVKTIPEKIDNHIVVFLDFFYAMKSYFDQDGWTTCFINMTSKRRQFTCETCDKLISSTVVCCSKCKKWFHAACKQASDKILKKKQ